jgi:hypothetical protein
MKQIIIDLVGTVGVGFLVYGVHLDYGLSISFILLGSIIIGWAALKSKGQS